MMVLVTGCWSAADLGGENYHLLKKFIFITLNPTFRLKFPTKRVVLQKSINQTLFPMMKSDLVISGNGTVPKLKL